MKKTTAAVVATLAAVALGSAGLATMDIQKEYKAKDPKANCATCHVPKMPKKDAAELNDFGKTVRPPRAKTGRSTGRRSRSPKPRADQGPSGAKRAVKWRRARGASVMR